MKSTWTCLLASAALVLAATGSFAQEVIPAVSLGDPIPSSQPDPNVIPVSGSSHHAAAACNTCSAPSTPCNGCKLDFQPCCDPGKGCKDIVVSVPCGCTSAPHCATCAKPAPCKACEVVKHARVHAPVAPACTTCAAPTPAPCKTCSAPAPCKTCSAPAPAPCATCAAPSCACEARKHVHSHTPALAACKACTTAPAPCKTCAAPAPAPCSACTTKPVQHRLFHAAPAPCAAKACDAPCKAAPPCDTCKATACKTETCKADACADPCKAAHTHARSAHSRPILDSLRGLFSGHGHAAKSETCGCSTTAPAGCSTCTAAAGSVAPSVATTPMQPQPAQIAPVQVPVAAPAYPMNPPVTSIPPSQPVFQPASAPVAPVPASLAPYNPNQFSTAYPMEPAR